MPGGSPLILREPKGWVATARADCVGVGRPSQVASALSSE